MSMKVENIDISCQRVDGIDTSHDRVDRTGRHRHVRFRPDRPYNELPPLPPAVDVETRAVLKARAALAV
jgi:hypothetical protein